MRNCFFPTPLSVVEAAVRQEVSGHYSRVLEPAVGDGALLAALDGNFSALVAFDINEDNLAKVSSRMSHVEGQHIKLECSDFLKSDSLGEFDLILANPPFDNNLSNHVLWAGRKIPIEAAFVVKCLSLLSPLGKAVFILPSSVVVGDKCAWLRNKLLADYFVKSVVKLPKYSFKKVEGGFYVLTVINEKRHGYRVLLAYDELSYELSSCFIREQGGGLDPERLLVSAKYSDVLNKTGVVDLCSLAEISRGNVCATGKKDYLYHSTNFSSHAAYEKPMVRGANSSAVLKQFDLALKRVGRGASDSFSVYQSKKCAPCSDCIIKIAPKEKSKISSYRLLLMLRVSVLLGGNALFEISGGGANYISLGRLRELRIPDFIDFKDDKVIRRYASYIEREQIFKARSMEKDLESKLLYMMGCADVVRSNA
ncbi:MULTISPECIES: N-6 DNA methylase [Pseudomonas]|uniref:N-6 DNA methylase n=1 Tax=Pseudomonas mosselii TaxID=78327 RepID=UPI001486FBC9|nr:N-6 DNA methylase [Pseudomonas mosselii]